MDKMDKVKTYMSLGNLLTIRGKDLTDANIKENNAELMKKIRELYHVDGIDELFEYLYCYVYMNYENLTNSYISFAKNSFVIISRNVSSDNVVYTLDRVSLIDDDSTPIKVDESKVIYNIVEDNYLVSKSTTYSTEQGLEMIRLESESVPFSGDMHLDELFEESKKLKHTSVLFRDVMDLLLLTEIKENNLDNGKKRITHYECDINDISRLSKDIKVTLEEHADSYEFNVKNIRNRIAHGMYPEFTTRALMYYRYADRFIDDISKVNQNESIREDAYEAIDSNRKMDEDLAEFIENNSIDNPADVIDIMEKLENKKTK